MSVYAKGFETIDDRVDLQLGGEHYLRFMRLKWAIEPYRGFFPEGGFAALFENPLPPDPTILFMLEAAEEKLKERERQNEGSSL